MHVVSPPPTPGTRGKFIAKKATDIFKHNPNYEVDERNNSVVWERIHFDHNPFQSRRTVGQHRFFALLCREIGDVERRVWNIFPFVTYFNTKTMIRAKRGRNWKALSVRVRFVFLPHRIQIYVRTDPDTYTRVHVRWHGVVKGLRWSAAYEGDVNIHFS